METVIFAVVLCVRPSTPLLRLSSIYFHRLQQPNCLSPHASPRARLWQLLLSARRPLPSRSAQGAGFCPAVTSALGVSSLMEQRQHVCLSELPPGDAKAPLNTESWTLTRKSLWRILVSWRDWTKSMFCLFFKSEVPRWCLTIVSSRNVFSPFLLSPFFSLDSPWGGYSKGTFVAYSFVRQRKPLTM